MKNFTIKVWTLSLLLLNCISGFTQNNKASEPKFPQKCYLFDNNGDVRSMTEKETMFVSKEERERIDEYDTIRIDTILIEKRLGKDDYLISRQGRDGYAVLHRRVIVPDSILGMSTPFQGKSLEDVEKQYQESKFPPYAKLQMQYVYSLAKRNRMEQAPGLDEISREDLIKSLSWREEIGDMLKTLLEENQEISRFRLRRLVENYRNQKLVEMGYNPYKQVIYNWEKQFEGDSEVIELLTRPMTFE